MIHIWSIKNAYAVEFNDDGVLFQADGPVYISVDSNYFKEYKKVLKILGGKHEL